MEIKRPFSEEDFQATPEPVRGYIIQLEDMVIKLFKETANLKKRVSKLENRLNKNSQNSSKPPSSDSPYEKPLKKTEKSKRKRGGQIGHKGHQQKRMEPATENILFPDTYDCGCSSFDTESIKPFYTHPVIELPKIEMDVRHFILNQGVCTQCGNIVKAHLPKEHQSGYGPRISALIAEVSGIQGNSRETVRTFCQSVLNFSISSGAIQKVIDRTSEALKPVYNKIGDIAQNSRVNHIDETSWFQNG
jgi:transposase